jgi:predicted alpha/beta-fold hydrolase
MPTAEPHCWCTLLLNPFGPCLHTTAITILLLSLIAHHCYNYTTNITNIDGGNFGLDWRDRDAGEKDLPRDAPVLLVVHGINGHSDEAYMLHALELAHSKGWRGVALLHRGCGGTVSCFL